MVDRYTLLSQQCLKLEREHIDYYKICEQCEIIKSISGLDIATYGISISIRDALYRILGSN